MKKYFLTFSLIAIVVLLTSFTITNNGTNEVDAVIRTIEGHRYIIVTSYNSFSSRPGGVAIIHAESCKCKKYFKK